MTLSQFARPVAIVLVAGLFFAPAGCGPGEPTKADSTKSEDGKDHTSKSGVCPGTVDADAHADRGRARGTVDRPHPQHPAQQAAEKFVTELRAAAGNPGPLSADLLARISPTFLKAIGKPLLSPDDKTRGYSAEAAGNWLRRVGGGLAGIGIPTGYGSTTAAVFVGSLNNGDGRFLLRLVQADGAWKVDWFGLGTARAAAVKPTAVDELFQDFAAQAFLDALTGPQSSEDRVLLLGAALSQKPRSEWAFPFGQDKDRGYDYNPGKLAELVGQLGNGVTAYTRTPTGPGQFKVVLTKGGASVVRVLKLVNGPAPGEWLVDEFVPPKE